MDKVYFSLEPNSVEVIMEALCDQLRGKESLLSFHAAELANLRGQVEALKMKYERMTEDE